MYACDLMEMEFRSYSNDSLNVGDFLGFDSKRACDYYPNHFNDVFSTLL